MIKFDGEVYTSIDKFDCHTIILISEGGGGYGTVIPISPKGYRDVNPTRAGVSVDIKSHQTNFHITSDLGEKFLVEIDNCHSFEIVSAIISANENGLIYGEPK